MLRIDVEIQLTVDADVEEVHLPASPSIGVTMARLSSSHPPFELLQAALLVPIHKSFQMKKKYKRLIYLI